MKKKDTKMKNRIKVLIANDEQMLVGTLRFMLERKYAVVTSCSKETTAIVAADNPDIRIVLIDKDCLGDGGIIGILRNTCRECRIVLYSGGVMSNEDPKKYAVDALLNSSAPGSIMEMISVLCPEEETVEQSS